MLNLGLSGGIGSGKSTVSRILKTLGAIIIDADKIAREVVEPGTDGLRQIRETFGETVLTPTGELDRGAMASLVFTDPARRADLEAITHPLIEARTRELYDAAPPDGVVVHDFPLLVEKNVWDRYHLVLIVDVAEQTRVERLVASRGLSPHDARARIAAQATDDQRRAAADILLDNNGKREQLERTVQELWRSRLEPFAANMAAQLAAEPAAATITDRELERALARIRRQGAAAAGFFPCGERERGSADPGSPIRLAMAELPAGT